MGIVGEVVAPELAPLLLNVLALVGLVVALGAAVLMTTIVALIVRVLKATVGHVPGVGGLIDSGASAFGSWFLEGWSQAIVGIEASVGHYWHAIGLEVKWLVDEVKAGANLANAMATIMVGQRELGAVVQGVEKIRRGLGTLEGKATGLLHRVTTLEHELTHLGEGKAGAALRTLLRPLEGELHALERFTYPKVKTIERELGQTVEPDIAALKERATALEDQAIRVYQDAAGAWQAVNVDALAAAVALALPALGLQWARCGNVGGAGRALCGLGGSLVSSLLADAVTAFAVADTCAFVAAAQDVAVELEPALLAFVDTAEALVGCHGAELAAPLDLPALILPATNAGLRLAA